MSKSTTNGADKSVNGEDSDVIIIDSSPAKPSASAYTSRPKSSTSSSTSQLPNLDGEPEGGPKDNWEVAYVYAFITKFTDLQSLTSTSSLLPNVFALEEALLESSPTEADLLTVEAAKLPTHKKQHSSSSLSSLSDVEERVKAEVPATVPTNPATRGGSPASSLSSISEGKGESQKQHEAEQELETELEADMDEYLDATPVPPASPLLVKIVETFLANLPEAEDSRSRNSKAWLPRLSRFVSASIISDYNPSWNAKPVSDSHLRTGGEGRLRFKRNLLRRKGEKAGKEREEDWWRLRWEDKAHILRILVDTQLDSSEVIRAHIKELYNLHHQKNARRDPENNELVIKAMGKHGKRTIWSLDDTPRLYCAGNPYRKDSPFTAITSTKEGYKKFVESLPAPPTPPPSSTEQDQPKEDDKDLAGPFKKAKLDAEKAKAKKAEKEKKTKKTVSEATQDLMSTRGKLEKHMSDIEQAEEALVALKEKKERAKERAALRDQRIAKQLSRLDAFSTTTRSSRLRTQTKRPDYVYQSSDVEDDTIPYASRKRRSANDSTQEGDAKEYAEDDEEGDEEEESEDPDTKATRRLRRGSGNGESGRPEWRGERRSNRIQLQEDADDSMNQEDDDDGEEDEKPAWKRPALPLSSSSSEADGAEKSSSQKEGSAESSPTEEYSEVDEKRPFKLVGSNGKAPQSEGNEAEMDVDDE